MAMALKRAIAPADPSSARRTTLVAAQSPFQTVHASFPHTAYRWSSRAACVQHANEDTGHPPQGRHPWGLLRDDDGINRCGGFGDHGQLLPRFSGFFKGLVGPIGHALTLTPVPEHDQSRAPSLRRRSGRRHPRYYGPLGLPPGTVTLRRQLIATAFTRRGPPGRVSPVPHQAFATCPLPYPEGVLWVSGHRRSTVCCLHRDMIGSATPRFGFLSHEAAEIHSRWARSFAPAPRGLCPAYGFRHSAQTPPSLTSPGACYTAHPACLPWRDSHPLVWYSIGTPPGVSVQDATWQSVYRGTADDTGDRLTLASPSTRRAS
jgi:hypothetical protein